jgi:hypothetical protein
MGKYPEKNPGNVGPANKRAILGNGLVGRTEIKLPQMN